MKIPENPPTDNGYYWVRLAPSKYGVKGDWEIVRLSWEKNEGGKSEVFVYVSEADNPELQWDEVQECFSEIEGPIRRAVNGKG